MRILDRRRSLDPAETRDRRSPEPRCFIGPRKKRDGHGAPLRVGPYFPSGSPSGVRPQILRNQSAPLVEGGHVGSIRRRLRTEAPLHPPPRGETCSYVESMKFPGATGRPAPCRLNHRVRWWARASTSHGARKPDDAETRAEQASPGTPCECFEHQPHKKPGPATLAGPGFPGFNPDGDGSAEVIVFPEP